MSAKRFTLDILGDVPVITFLLKERIEAWMEDVKAAGIDAVLVVETLEEAEDVEGRKHQADQD